MPDGRRPAALPEHPGKRGARHARFCPLSERYSDLPERPQRKILPGLVKTQTETAMALPGQAVAFNYRQLLNMIDDENKLGN